MSGRWCKTCRHLRRQDLDSGPMWTCGWTMPEGHFPWACATARGTARRWLGPMIGKRHVVPGDDYTPDADGSTRDWSEIMDCATWEDRDA